MNKEKILTSNNGWQNIGVMQDYAMRNNIYKNEFIVFTAIVRYSFGYGKIATNPNSSREWGAKLGMNKDTFLKALNKLVESGHVIVNKFRGFKVGGGTGADTYSPVFPKFAKIFIADEVESEIKKEKMEF